VRGTVTPTGTVTVTTRDGRALKQTVNIMGRVRSCAPAPGLPGYRTC
jgi:type IV fimbrial biogenesis protein FimT